MKNTERVIFIILNRFYEENLNDFFRSKNFSNLCILLFLVSFFSW